MNQSQGRRGNVRDRYGSQGSLNRRNDSRRQDNNDRRRGFDNNRRQPFNNNRRFGQANRRNFQSRFQQQDRRTRLQRLARLSRRDDNDRDRKTDEKTTALRRKLAEKHVNKRPRQDLLAKKIRMAKMRR